jgi:hypothetical protein
MRSSIRSQPGLLPYILARQKSIESSSLRASSDDSTGLVAFERE